MVCTLLSEAACIRGRWFAWPSRPTLHAVAAQLETRGLGVVLLGVLTERQWVKEDDLAKETNLHPKMVRRALRYLEQVGVCMGEGWGRVGGARVRVHVVGSGGKPLELPTLMLHVRLPRPWRCSCAACHMAMVPESMYACICKY